MNKKILLFMFALIVFINCILLAQYFYLVYILTEMMGRKSMVFTQSCGPTLLLALILKNLGFKAIPIISYMSQVIVL